MTGRDHDGRGPQPHQAGGDPEGRGRALPLRRLDRALSTGGGRREAEWRRRRSDRLPPCRLPPTARSRPGRSRTRRRTPSPGPPSASPRARRPDGDRGPEELLVVEGDRELGPAAVTEYAPTALDVSSRPRPSSGPSRPAYADSTASPSQIDQQHQEVLLVLAGAGSGPPRGALLENVETAPSWKTALRRIAAAIESAGRSRFTWTSRFGAEGGLGSARTSHSAAPGRAEDQEVEEPRRTHHRVRVEVVADLLGASRRRRRRSGGHGRQGEPEASAEGTRFASTRKKRPHV